MTPTQFAAKTRNLAKRTGLNAQLVQRHFMMDRLTELGRSRPSSIGG